MVALALSGPSAHVLRKPRTRAGGAEKAVPTNALALGAAKVRDAAAAAERRRTAAGGMDAADFDFLLLGENERLLQVDGRRPDMLSTCLTFYFSAAALQGTSCAHFFFVAKIR